VIADISVLLGFVAGLLSFLNPCVLPLIPMVLASAQSGHRLGPVALGAGLALSSTAIGLFIATIGFSIGLDERVFRLVGGALLAGAGIVLLLPALQLKFATASAPIGNWASNRMAEGSESGLFGQFSIGALLGLVWIPCVGPTLGAATVLAAQGENLGQVAAVMFAFGIGAAIPLVMIGTLSARALSGQRKVLKSFGHRGKQLLGAMLVIVGVLVVSGADRLLEAYLTQAAPDWLIALTTRF
jgi:cytochrome c-type biogenesis protein